MSKEKVCPACPSVVTVEEIRTVLKEEGYTKVSYKATCPRCGIVVTSPTLSTLYKALGNLPEAEEFTGQWSTGGYVPAQTSGFIPNQYIVNSDWLDRTFVYGPIKPYSPVDVVGQSEFNFTSFNDRNSGDNLGTGI